MWRARLGVQTTIEEDFQPLILLSIYNNELYSRAYCELVASYFSRLHRMVSTTSSLYKYNLEKRAIRLHGHLVPKRARFCQDPIYGLRLKNGVIPMKPNNHITPIHKIYTFIVSQHSKHLRTPSMPMLSYLNLASLIRAIISNNFSC